jgi:Protein of unknown function (DUF1579)/THAP4-like, heme-binding beta-barrel domain
MKTICRSSIVAALLVSSAALAQPAPAEKKPAPPPAPADKIKPAEPAAAPMVAPKPDPALEALAPMIGTWKCEGKMMMGGKEMAWKATAKFAWDLDKFWVVASMDTAKTKDMPAHKGRGYYGYDPATKQYTQMMVDNMGGWSMATSKGQNGQSMEWMGKASMMGQTMDLKSTVTYTSPKEVTIKGTMGQGASAMTDEMTCKK